MCTGVEQNYIKKAIHISILHLPTLETISLNSISLYKHFRAKFLLFLQLWTAFCDCCLCSYNSINLAQYF